MIISLIGMSGSGKSFWAKKLEKKGFKSYSIDELIEAKLKKELKKLSYTGLSGVGKWMGHPFEDQYKKTSQVYLSFEKESMQKIFARIEKESQNIVIDTTGSVIYLNKNILKALTKITKIIYLKNSPAELQQMYEFYLKNPRPVIWGNIFKPKKGENNSQALARCYPQLLKYRATRYAQLADLTLDATELKSPTFSLEKFTNIINKL